MRRPSRCDGFPVAQHTSFCWRFASQDDTKPSAAYLPHHRYALIGALVLGNHDERKALHVMIRMLGDQHCCEMDAEVGCWVTLQLETSTICDSTVLQYVRSHQTRTGTTRFSDW